jgi:hypothetical protein
MCTDFPQTGKSELSENFERALFSSENVTASILLMDTYYCRLQKTLKLGVSVSVRTRILIFTKHEWQKAPVLLQRRHLQ